MAWPQFDASVAINQAVAALYTLTGVAVGGYLAFRYGIRQLRNAQAISRRIQWHEQLLATIGEYQRLLYVLLSIVEDGEGSDESPIRFRKTAVEMYKHVTDLHAQLSRAELYFSAERQGSAEQLAMAEIDVFLNTRGFDRLLDGDIEAALKIKGFLDLLRDYKSGVIRELRAELGFERG
jgi:hypothetical protein